MRIIPVIIGLVFLIMSASAIVPVQLSGTTHEQAMTITHQIPTIEDNITTNLTALARQQPGIYNARVIIDANHIGITLQPSITCTGQTMDSIIGILITAYQGIIQTTNYRGLLRIGVVNNFKLVTDLYEVPANADFITHTGISYYRRNADWLSN